MENFRSSTKQIDEVSPNFEESVQNEDTRRIMNSYSDNNTPMPGNNDIEANKKNALVDDFINRLVPNRKKQQQEDNDDQHDMKPNTSLNYAHTDNDVDNTQINLKFEDEVYSVNDSNQQIEEVKHVQGKPQNASDEEDDSPQRVYSPNTQDIFSLLIQNILRKNSSNTKEF